MSGPPLVAIQLTEKDVNGDLLSWHFPTVDAAMEQVVHARCGLNDAQTTDSFRFFRYANTWVYSMLQPIDRTKNPQIKVVSSAVSILAQDFNPPKYKAMLTIFCATYEAENSPMGILKGYLSVFNKGSMQTKFGNFTETDFDGRKALIAPIKPFFEMFGLETVVIWVAMLIKKRVFVYCDKLPQLLSAVRAFPLLGAWHRQNWTILRPYVTTSESDLKDLASTAVYVAGFTDPSCQGHTQLYDLFVDLSARTYTIADHAQADFALLNFHKQTAEAFLAIVESGSEQDLIKGIAVKTKELIGKVEEMKTEHEDGSYVTLDELTQKKKAQNMTKFLFNVAMAEGMCRN